MPKALEMEVQPQSDGWQRNLRNQSYPKIKLITEIPKNLLPKGIEKAVALFIAETNIQANREGLYNQTIESIAGATFLKPAGGGGQFWLVEERDECLGYVLGSISKDVDNRLCYWISQAWLHPKYRGTGIVKEYWSSIKAHAKACFCKHIVVVSGRGDKVYQRFLGKGFHLYANLIKEDI